MSSNAPPHRALTPDADALARALEDPSRLAALAASGLLSEVHNVPALERTAALAAAALRTPVAQVNLVTADAQVPAATFTAPPARREAWTDAVGLEASYCKNVVAMDEPVAVVDARVDPLVRGNVATSDAGIVGYLAVPLRTPTGQVLGSVCVVDFAERDWDEQDVTLLSAIAEGAAAEVATRLAARVHARQLADRLELAVETARLGIWTWDLATGEAELDDRVRAMFGVAPGVRLAFPEPILSMLHPDDRDAVARVVGRALDPASDGRYEAEFRVVHADGSVRWVLGRGQVEFDDAGGARRAALLFGTMLDLTDSKVGDAERTRLRAEFEAAARDQQFLLDLTSALQQAPAEDPAAIAHEGARRLARWFGLPRAHLYDVVEGADGGWQVSLQDYRHDPGAPAIRGRRPLTDLPPAVVEELRRGVVVVDDCASDPRTAGHYARLYEPFGVRALLGVAMHDHGRWEGGVTLLDERSHAWTERELTLMQRAAVRIWSAYGIAKARAAAAHAERRLAFLARASADLATALDVHAALDVLGRLAVPTLADWCFVEMVEDIETGEGEIVPHVVAHEDAAMVALGWEYYRRWPVRRENPVGTAAVLRSGTPELVPDIPPQLFALVAHDAEHQRFLESIGFRSSIQAPIRLGGRVVGVFTLATTDASGRRFDADDLRLAEELGVRASVALERAALLERERRARAEAEEASRAKSAFLATMSHELRTPLNAIIGYMDLLDLGVRGELAPAQRDDVVRTRAASRHLLGLINQILNRAKLDAGQVTYAIEPVPVVALLESVEPFIGPQLRARGLEYRCDLGAVGALAVHADAEKARQVLLNLASNAVKFTERGAVELSAARDGDVVRIRLRDTGRGIPAAKLEAVFEPFVQLDAPLTREGGGTGLGLAISRDLARGMGGELTVESVEGEGTTFTFTLPVAG